MQSAISAQELPVRSALTVGVRCVNRTRKHAASVTAYSVLRACPSIQCSTPKLHQQTTANVESEKELKDLSTTSGRPTQNRLDARSAVRCSNRVGCRVSNAFCCTFRYVHFLPVSTVAFSHHCVAAASLKGTSPVSAPLVSKIQRVPL